MPNLVRVDVVDGRETIETWVTGDIDDRFYELPEPLVEEYKEARDRWERAQAAIVRYIEDHHLQPHDLDDEEPHDCA